MSDVFCRRVGTIGHITLKRPDALNALTHDMSLEIEKAIDAWRHVVTMVLIDAEGDKAFCAGGDVVSLYDSALRGDLSYGRKFWQDEYRLNVKISEYPVPVVSFLQGFVMGGGVGVGCHCSHRIVSENSKIAMPECGIGLIPDVGGSLILAKASNNLGKYLGLTGARMGPGDAIFAGFADMYVPYDQWLDLKSILLETGDISSLSDFAGQAPESNMEAMLEIDLHFSKPNVPAILASLKASNSDFAKSALKGLSRGAPLALACCFEVVSRLRGATNIRTALELEYRYTSRAIKQGDFPEGIRAAIVDKDNAPKWAHASSADVKPNEVDAMLAELGEGVLNLETSL